MSGKLSALGELDPGPGTLSVLISPITVPDEEVIEITDFGATVKDTNTTSNTGSYFRLEVSTDGFVTYRKASIIEIVQGGTVLKTLESPIVLYPGSSFRVRAKQDVVTRVSAEVTGRTLHNDISG